MISVTATAVFFFGFFIAFVEALLRSPYYGLPIDGEVRLYEGVYYDKPFRTYNIMWSNRCYQLDCDNLDNRVASARWSGLPTEGFKRKHVLISFYANADCKGAQESVVLPHNGGIREFLLKTVIGKISAFMERHDSLEVQNGYGSVCNDVSVTEYPRLRDCISQFPSNFLHHNIMLFFRFVILSTFLGVFTDIVSGYTRFKGEIKLYSGENYNYQYLTLKLDTSNRCYHFDCNLDIPDYIIDHRTQSANWTGLPTTGLWETAYLYFYATTNCTGDNGGAQLVKSTGGVSHFSTKLRGRIMSFKVLADSLVVDRGVQAVCTGKIEDDAKVSDEVAKTISL